MEKLNNVMSSFLGFAGSGARSARHRMLMLGIFITLIITSEVVSTSNLDLLHLTPRLLISLNRSNPN
ncbi:MAG: hypothetical protein KF687_11445 [Cyclobacteriaceae bacterium]|nr:hypothetical protein [Cyclobacteriaceae bacterium]